MRPTKVSGIVTGDALVSYWQEPIFLVPSKIPEIFAMFLSRF